MRATAEKVKRSLALAAALGVLFLVYAPSLGGGFVSDDVLYLEHNANLRLPFLKALPRLLSSSYFANWSPLHHLLLYAEWQLFGMDPLGYRIVNLLLHALTACSCAALLRRAGLTGAAAALGGALLLIHPAAAESVAWINQSKTLLATLLALVALERWLAHLAEPAPRRLAAALGAATLALLAKPAVVFLPALFALAIVTHGRERRDALPWALALALPAGLVLVLNLQAQASEGGVVPWFGGSPEATARILPWMLWRYLRLSVLPFDVVHGAHPAPIASWLDPGVLAPAAAIAASVAAGVLLARRCPRRTLALGWFALALAPVVQLVPMTTVFADRYLFVALPGALALAAEGLDALGRRTRRAGRVLFSVTLAALLAALGLATRERARLWAHPEALYADAVATFPASRAGWVGLGAERQRRDDLEGAAAAYLRALALEPRDGHVRHLLARVRLRQQRLGEALYDLEEALRLAPGHYQVEWTRTTARQLRSRGVQPVEDRE